jgi:hypothetical protein
MTENKISYMYKGIQQCLECRGGLYRFERTGQYIFYRCEYCGSEFYWTRDDDL